MTKGLAFGLVVLVGCTAEPVRPEQPYAQVDLRTALDLYVPNVIGVTIAPDGARYVFEETVGLYRIDGDVGTQLVSMNQMPTADKPVRLPFTDIVALSPNVFAMTAIGDGFLLDISALTLTQHFCYVPDGGDGFPTVNSQRTDAIAYDAVEDKIYAQPLTYNPVGDLQLAQVSRYNRVSGVDEEWFDAPIGTRATGSVFMPGVGLLLGQDAKLSRYDVETRQVIEIDDLRRFGVASIDGLAIDTERNTLVVVDQLTDSMFDIDLDTISL